MKTNKNHWRLPRHGEGELLKEFAALQRMLNITTAHITHDESEAVALANCIILMCEGQLTRTGMMNNPIKG